MKGMLYDEQRRASTTPIDDLWYKNAIIYCLDGREVRRLEWRRYRRLGGLTRRLDYLAGLGSQTLLLGGFSNEQVQQTDTWLGVPVEITQSGGAPRRMKKKFGRAKSQLIG
jgi:hypothetical protein